MNEKERWLLSATGRTISSAMTSPLKRNVSVYQPAFLGVNPIVKFPKRPSITRALILLSGPLNSIFKFSAVITFVFQMRIEIKVKILNISHQKNHSKTRSGHNSKEPK
jgi:hypothetical protein